MIKRKKFIWSILVALAILIVGVTTYKVSFAASDTQTITYKNLKATSEVRPNPAVYWYQLDDGSFKAETMTGDKISAQHGSNNDATPVKTSVRDQIDLSNYDLPPSFLHSESGRTFTRSALSRMYLHDVQFGNQIHFEGISTRIVNDKFVELVTRTGEKPFTDRSEYGKRYGTNIPKFTVRYDTPLKVIWRGEVEETKQIRVVEDSVLGPGQTKQYKAEVRTKLSGGSWSNWVDVTNRSETTWSSNRSGVATVSGSGLVTAKSTGKADISATWKSDGFTIVSSATADVSDGDLITINTPKKGPFCLAEDVRLSATLVKKDGSQYTLTAHPKLTWTSSNTAVAAVTSSGVVTPKKVGTTTITAHFNDTSQGINVKDTLSFQVIDCTVTPPPTEPADDNEPPEVTILGPSVIKAGDEFCISAYATDSDGTIEGYSWSTGSMQNGPTSHQSKCEAYYLNEGTYTVSVTVTDDDGATGNDTTQIEVIPPTPEALVTFTGTLKENRKFTANDQSTTPKHYPINQSYITLKPLDGQSVNSLKSTYAGLNIEDGKVILEGEKTYDLLSKLKGRYEVYQYVRNTANLTDEFTTTVTIAEDEKPVVDFSTVTKLYRDDIENYPSKTVIKATDKSYSEDDEIAQRVWTYRYDSDNDGSYDDEPLQVISNGNDEEVSFETTRVGKYKIELIGIEKFMQPTIDEFVTEDDRRRNDTGIKVIEQKVVEVDNLAPIAGFDVGKKKKVKLQIASGESHWGDRDQMISTLNTYLKPSLAAENIELQLEVEQNLVGAGEIKHKYMEVTKLYQGRTLQFTYFNDSYYLMFRDSYKKMDSEFNTIEDVSLNVGDGFSYNFSTTNDTLNAYYRIGEYNYQYPTGKRFNGHNLGSAHEIVLNGYNTRFSANYNNGNANFIETYENGTRIDSHIINKQDYGWGPTWKLFKLNKNQVLALTSLSMNIVTVNTDGTIKVEDSTAGGYPSFDDIRHVHSFQLPYTFVIDSKLKSHYTKVEYHANNIYSLNYYGDGRKIELEKNIDSRVFDINRLLGAIEVNDRFIIVASNFTDKNTKKSTVKFYLIDRKTGSVKTSSLPVSKEIIESIATLENHNAIYKTNEAAFALRHSDITASLISVPLVPDLVLENGDEDHYFLAGLHDEELTNDVVNSLKTKMENVDVEFIGLGNQANKEQFESLNKDILGTFIHNSPKEEAIENLADYIITTVKANKSAELQIDLSNSPFSEEVIQAKFNEIVKPIMNENRINLNFKMFAKQDYTKDIIATGIDNTVVVSQDGTVTVFGRNDMGQLGLGHKNATVATPTINPNLKNIVSASCGEYHCLFLDKDGSVFSSGRNLWGELGIGKSFFEDGSQYETFSTPQKVSLPKIISIATNRKSSYAIDENHNVWSWGNGASFVLGTDSTADRKSPQKINISDVIQISAKMRHVLALKKDGTVWGWGDNSNYALTSKVSGQSSYYVTVPTKIPDIVDIKQVTTDEHVSTFLKKDGSVYGVGTFYRRFDSRASTGTVVKIPGLSSIKYINSDSQQEYYDEYKRLFAINEQGELFALGRNNLGQAGDGTTTDLTTVQNIKLDKPAAYVYTSIFHTVAVLNDGQIITWGKGNNGALGNGLNQSLVPKSTNHKVLLKSTTSGGFEKRNVPLFTSLITNKEVQETYFESLDGLGSNFIGIGDEKSLDTLEGIITKNGSGIYLENTNIDLFMTNMAAYILDELKNVKKVELSFGLGDTIHKDMDSLKSKINSIIVPKLNQEGIKVSSLNIQDTTFKEHTAELYNKGFYGGFINYHETIGTRFSVSKSVTLTSILIPNTNSTRRTQRHAIWDDKGKKLGEGSMEYSDTTKLYKLDFGKPIQLEPNRKYYLGFYQTKSDGSADAVFVPSRSATIQQTISVDGISITYRGARGPSGEPPTNDNGGYGMPEITIQFQEGTKPQEVKTNTKNVFSTFIEDNELTEDRINNLTARALLSRSHAIGFGNAKNQSQFERLVQKNLEKGTFINNSNLDSSLNQLADYIIAEMKRTADMNELYLTLEEEAEYFTTYEDPELDPKHRERWRYEHKPTVFENDMGVVSFNSKNMDSPIKLLGKVGRFQTIHAAQDNPIHWSNEAFANYRKWSKEADNWYIYVHRKPIPDFAFTINGTTGDYNITNKAYDLDKQSINIGHGDGLSAMSYEWREKGATAWIAGLPTGPLQRKEYEVMQTVTDFQFRTESTTRIMDATGVNKKPIADFIPIPDTVKVGEEIFFKNLSYDPNGDPLTAQWSISPKGANIYVDMGTEWEPTELMGVEGEFDVKLVVKDTLGATDEVIKQVTVIPNNSAPVACMNIPTPNYIGDTIVIENCATDVDGDALSFTYTIEKATETITISSGDSRIDSDGNVTIIADQHPTDLGTWTITQEVSDGKDAATVSGSLEVLDQIVEGQVNHTQQWLANLQKFNAENPSRAYNLNPAYGMVEFYPGEKFILKATETEEAATIDVHIKEYRTRFGSDSLSESGVSNIWDGSLWHEDMGQVFSDQEELTFVFTATFQNGWVDTDEVKVKIKTDPYWRQHTTF